MHKSELIDYIVETTHCKKAEAEQVINVFTKAITDILGEGKEVNLIGFGKFYASKTAAREGKNPKTGEKLQIPAQNQPRFSAGQNLKKACNK